MKACGLKPLPLKKGRFVSVKIKLLAFSHRGALLCKKLCDVLGAQGEEVQGFAAEAYAGRAGLCVKREPLAEWTARAFGSADALVFVGACGIAVRAIAPLLRGKTKDPAVVVLDESGRFCISLVSGHLGGANELAQRCAAIVGAQPVITTATDVRGVFAADDWARRNGCFVANPRAIQEISGRLLDAREVGLFSRFAIQGELPAGVTLGEHEAGICLSCRVEKPFAVTLNLVPRAVTLGIGCRRGTRQESIAQAVRAFLEENQIPFQAIQNVASIDLKKEEEGLLDFCQRHGLPFYTYSASQLMSPQVQGEFSSSPFVLRTTGADNVCERAAVCHSGGALLAAKTARDGVTVAAAVAQLRFRFPDGSGACLSLEK